MSIKLNKETEERLIGSIQGFFSTDALALQTNNNAAKIVLCKSS